MTIAEINALTLDDVFVEILYRMVDFAPVPQGFPDYTVDDQQVDVYDQYVLHASVSKPAKSAMEAEFLVYQQELLDAENARLTEVARVQDIKDRFEAISDIRGAISQASLTISNPLAELQRIIDEDDQARLSLLETKGTEWDTAQSTKAAEDAEYAAYSSLVDTIHGCVKIIMKHNNNNTLTDAQLDQQATDNPSLFDALNKWRPGKFKTLVTALVPDGTLVQQALKDELLTFLTSRGV